MIVSTCGLTHLTIRMHVQNTMYVLIVYFCNSEILRGTPAIGNIQ